MQAITISIAAIDAALPQTQCTRCGYRDCADYAAAIARDGAPIDRCPPGGEATLDRLAALTGRPRGALDPSCGAPGPLRVALVDEAECIGCTLCIRACPVDAILGAPKRMHVVVAALCSGCDLCVAPCPVDCIDLVPAGREWTPADAAAARDRHRARDARLARGERIAERGRASPARGADPAARRRAAVDAALERARARRGRVRAGP